MRFNRYRTHRIIGDSRTFSVYGNPDRGEDAGKWFRCWNCGFLCNIDRDALVESSNDGIKHEDSFSMSPGFTADPLTGMSVLQGQHVSMLQDADGNIDTSYQYHYKKVTISQGCPLCGCLKWRR